MSDRFYYGTAPAKWADVVVRPGESIKHELRAFLTGNNPPLKVFAETQDMLDEVIKVWDVLYQQDEVWVRPEQITHRVAEAD